MLLAASLASGSSGNAYWIGNDRDGILVDAGLSAKRTAESLHVLNTPPPLALLISHDHSDHASGAGVIARRFGIPLYITHGTWQRLHRRLGRIDDLHLFTPGDVLTIGTYQIRTFPTTHDGKEPAVFVVEGKQRRVGILTDLGTPDPGFTRLISRLDAVFLEANYDPEMLKDGPYPWFLQERIRSAAGHISNAEAGELIRACQGRQLRRIVLSHLSESNNSPELAMETVSTMISDRLHLSVAPRHVPSELFEV